MGNQQSNGKTHTPLGVKTGEQLGKNPCQNKRNPRKNLWNTKGKLRECKGKPGQRKGKSKGDQGTPPGKPMEIKHSVWLPSNHDALALIPWPTSFHPAFPSFLDAPGSPACFQPAFSSLSGQCSEYLPRSFWPTFLSFSERVFQVSCFCILF